MAKLMDAFVMKGIESSLPSAMRRLGSYKLGREVEGAKEGNRIAVNAITPCYKCENCLRGDTSQCTQMLGGCKFANIKDGVSARVAKNA